MAMTYAEKILSKASSRDRVTPGEFVKARVDLVMVNEITGPLTVKAFYEMGFERVFDRDRVVIVFDHNIPASDINAAARMKELRQFARDQGLRYFYDVGRGGVEHQLLVERGHALPGALLIGADSHTCTSGALGAFATGVGSTDAALVFGTGKIWLKIPETVKMDCRGGLKEPVTSKDLILHIIGEVGADGMNYRAVEFCGEAVEGMSIDSRLTMTNMTVEMGGKTGIIEPDEKTITMIKGITGKEPQVFHGDRDAEYGDILEFDTSSLEPQVAIPYRVDNVKNVREVGDVEIDQAFIGSCTNGRLEDLRLAARIIKGRKIHPYVRLVVIPATQKIYKEAFHEGLIDIFIDAGAQVCGPTCGPCIGTSQGVLAAGEICISTSNRNFMSRMGHRDSKVYLASPATVAASAITGRITDPRGYIG